MTSKKEISKKLHISKKMRGDDGYKVFSVRIKDETIIKLESISQQTNRSRNELINILLDFAIDNCQIEE